MNEGLLHFIWAHRLYNGDDLRTLDGASLDVLHPGHLHRDQGPDFKHARLRIGGLTLAGAVELHLKTSDWDRHGHGKDSNYASVVLHVVYRHDRPCDTPVPVLELEPRIPLLMLRRWSDLKKGAGRLPCGKAPGALSPLQWAGWRSRLLAERFLRKRNEYAQLLAEEAGDWNRVAWRCAAAVLGGPVNGWAFSQTARAVPLTVLERVSLQPLAVEALLFGAAGLLEGKMPEGYPAALQREWRYQSKKLEIAPAAVQLAYLRMRPAGFPDLRLAQLAAFVRSGLTGLGAHEDFTTVVLPQVHPYWHTHSRLLHPAAHRNRNPGKPLLLSWQINAVRYLQAAKQVEAAAGLFLLERALEALPPEDNREVRLFIQAGMRVSSALDSQALLELNRSYCQQLKCLSCAIGFCYLRSGAFQPPQST